jgi:dephospho-CoA kinase
MRLIGLSGTNGSGKDTIGQLLQDKYNYLFISMTDMLRDEAISRRQETSRDVLRSISAEWRRESGLGVLIDKSIQVYERQGGDAKFSGLVVASLRNPGENDHVHELGGKVIWIDANPKIRYARIFSRLRADDPVSFEKFVADEQAEMQHSGDEATLSMSEVKEKCDQILVNNSETVDELEQTIATELAQML